MKRCGRNWAIGFTDATTVLPCVRGTSLPFGRARSVTGPDPNSDVHGLQSLRSWTTRGFGSTSESPRSSGSVVTGSCETFSMQSAIRA